jgi:hypothetical protein
VSFRFKQDSDLITWLKSIFEDFMIRKILLVALFATGLSACAPEVGSERWCEAMKEKPKGDWTANELKDFTKYCLLNQKPE